MESIIIIGAGAAGLQAARCLSEAGYPIVILEAAAEPGGRIMSITPKGFSVSVEGGAEFIHGELPLSLGLAKEVGAALSPVSAKMERGDGEPQNDWMDQGWDRLMDEMGKLEADIPVAEFLARHFGEAKWSGLRERVSGFAEGYDLADLRRVSTTALYREWSKEEDAAEWRVEGGYGRIVHFLAGLCVQMRVMIRYSSVVTEITWKEGWVRVRTATGQLFEAAKLIITVSLGVLQKKLLRFSPALPELDEALPGLGYGSVIKILMEFRRPFWLKKKPKGQTLFIVSREAVPTWWSQTDDECPLLTGWLAGEKMRRFQQLGKAERLDSCLRSLAGIFSADPEWLRQELAASLVLDWAGMPFVLGGYSFETVEAATARARLLGPIGDTLYFCGEAFYEGDAPGTVEAAFCSGRDVAERIRRTGP